MRAAALSRLPNLYLGTMTFGWKSQTSSPVDDTVASQMVQSFLDHHAASSALASPAHIDTARIYAGGDSERMLAPLLADDNTLDGIVLGTKCHPSQTDGLSSKGIRDQLDASLQAMRVTAVNEYYLHQPDERHSLLESLRTLNSLIEEGS